MREKSQNPLLIVEDSLDDFEAVQRAFDKAGLSHPIEHLASGEAALEYLSAGDKPWPYLILMDLNMPGMGGRKALELIKQHPGLREIPVVVLTTSNYEADVSMCYALGANTYIQKPMELGLLNQAAANIKEYWLETALLPAQPYFLPETLDGAMPSGTEESGGPPAWGS
jgi:two-component system response regulator